MSQNFFEEESKATAMINHDMVYPSNATSPLKKSRLREEAKFQQKAHTWPCGCLPRVRSIFFTNDSGVPLARVRFLASAFPKQGLKM